MFGKFTDNKAGMEDEGEYCEKCFDLRKEKHGLITPVNIKPEEINIAVVL